MPSAQQLAPEAPRPGDGRWLRGVARRLAVDAVPFAILAVTYQALGLVRTAVAAAGVHTRWPYLVDKRLFGVVWRGARWSLNELFSAVHWPVVDLVAGVAYLLYIWVVMAFALFMGVIDRTSTGRRRVRGLGWTFLGVNLAGFATYLALPVAPPWYVAARGFGPVDPHAVASPAALVRWDAMTGFAYFKHFYAQATDVFGAMPSLHCAYPMLLLLYATELRRPVLTGTLVIFQLVMCFSAIYLQHHYVFDVLAGMGFAVLGYAIERRVRGRIGQVRRVPAGAWVPQ